MKTVHAFLLVFLTVLVASCRVTIPATDNTRPTFILNFVDSNGDLIHSFDEADNLSALTMNLREGQEYTLFYITRDSGGVQEASFTYPNTLEVIRPMPNPDTPPSTWIEQPGASNKTFLWTGDRMNPKDGTAYAINFSADGVGQRFTISFSSEDYGGSGGISTDGNVRSGSLNMVYSTRPSGVE